MSRRRQAADPAAPRRIRLLLVDDHEVVRLGLAAVLGRSETVTVVGEAATAAAAVTEARRLKPDLVLMDLRLPDGSGLEACREIMSDAPGARVLFLTSYSDEEAVTATLLAGAAGYLLKDIGHRSLIRAIESVADGQSIVDSRMAQPIARRMQILIDSSSGPLDALSPQEKRILNLVVQGKTNREIAAALRLSKKTVKNYLSNAFQKLRVGRRSQAAALYSRMGASAG